MDKHKVVAAIKAGSNLVLLACLLDLSIFVIQDKVRDFQKLRDLKKEYAASVEYENTYLVNEKAAYNEYIQAVAEFIRYYGMDDDPLKVYKLYATLLNSGYLSINNWFISEESDYELINNYGITIPLGEGVCRNKVDGLCDVYEALGYDVSFVTGEFTTKRETGKVNHALVCVRDGNIIYLVDPTNNEIFLHTWDGLWKSIFTDNLVFYLSPSKDDVCGIQEKNQDLYNYTSNDYKDREYYIDKIRSIQEDIDDQYVDFSLYEKLNLQKYEENFIKEFDYHINEINKKMGLK